MIFSEAKIPSIKMYTKISEGNIQIVKLATILLVHLGDDDISR